MSETQSNGEALIPVDPPPKEELFYNSHLEEVIADEAEKALVLRWLHNQSERKYSKLNTCIAIPVIVISTLAGTASIGQTSMFGSGTLAPILIGIMSISVSILNVVGSFFSWAKRAEGHRIASTNYGKLHHWINIELALPRSQRIVAKHFLKDIRQQVDRLNENSPIIPEDITDSFRVKMKKLDANVTLPEICNEIRAVEVYRGPNIERDVTIAPLDGLVSEAASVLSKTRKKSDSLQAPPSPVRFEETPETPSNTVIRFINPSSSVKTILASSVST